MNRMDGSPSFEMRGDIILPTKYIPGTHLLAPDLLYWTGRYETVGPGVNLASEVPRILADRFSSLVGYRVQFDRGRENLSDAELGAIQVAASSTLAMSALMKRVQSGQLLQSGGATSRPEQVDFAFDPAGLELCWYIRQGEETGLLEAYEGPGDEAVVWYEEDDILVNTSRPAIPTPAFLGSFRRFYGPTADFDGTQYTAITPIIKRSVLDPVVEA